MYTFRYNSANAAWMAAVRQLHLSAEKQESRNFRDARNTTETLELMPVCITIDEPLDRVVFARPINPAFAIAEVIWILAGGEYLNFLEFWNPRMKTWSDDGNIMHGAYGWRLGSSPIGQKLCRKGFSLGIDQLYTAYRILSSKPYQRQVILQIWNAAMDMPYLNGTSQSKDIPCNIFSDLKVRNGKLHWHQYMRSNDLIWGTPYNFIQWTTIHEIMAGWLGLEVGPYNHIVTSLHVYKHHFDELEALVSDPEAGYPYPTIGIEPLAIEGYNNWQKIFKVVVDAALYLIQVDHIDNLMINWPTYMTSLIDHKGYRQWLWVLYYEALRRKGWLQEEFRSRAKEDMGSYWWMSYAKWYYSQKEPEGD